MSLLSAKTFHQVQGDMAATAWARVGSRIPGYVTSFLRRHRVQEADAADIAQRAFLELVERLPRMEWKGPWAFEGYLNKVLRNALIRTARDNRKAGLPVADLVSLAEQLADPGSTPSRELCRMDECVPVLAALEEAVRSGEFDRKDTEAFLLKYADYKSHLEISALLGISVPSSQQRCCRVMKFMKKQFPK